MRDLRYFPQRSGPDSTISALIKEFLNQNQSTLMKKLLFLLLFTGGMMVAMAQQVVTIRQIQERSLADLNACNDDSPFLDSTVTIFAVVVTDGSIEDPTNPGSGNLVRNAPVTTHHNIWVADSIGRPWAGIDVFHLNGETNGPTTPTSLLDLVAGDSVKITGTIDEFRGTETEIFPTSVELIGTATQQITAGTHTSKQDCAVFSVL